MILSRDLRWRRTPGSSTSTPRTRRGDSCHACWDTLTKYGGFASYDINKVFQSRATCPGCELFATVLMPYKERITHSSTFRRIPTITSFDFTLSISFTHTAEDDLILEIFKPSGTGDACPWDAIFERSIISGDTGSEAAAARISHWVQTCSDSHERCKGVSDPQQLPTRVVEILGPRTVRLRTTRENEVARYSTLSHAWGHGNTTRTISSTLQVFQDAIPCTDLPKTFQEAINVTFQLGLKYLWIDSLCIIQDDDEDWRKEGSRMASIYSRSYLTIAATKSSNSNGGCFSVANDHYVGRIHELKNDEGNPYTIHVRHELAHLANNKTEFPLLDRAWVFQERLLSIRTLHFGPNEMLWECMSCSTCECDSWSDTLVVKSKHIPSEFCEEKLSIAWQWHDLIEEYSEKNLTFDSDIFPALQGVSKRMQKQRQCAYYAGLWEGSLLEDLLWYYRAPGAKPQSWRAPSWSWASGTGRVRWPNMSRDFRPCFTVLDISTEPVGSDPLGQLKAGSLRLTGPCTATTVRLDKKSISHYTLRVGKPGKGRRHRPLIRFYPDLEDTCTISADAPLMLMKAARGTAYFKSSSEYDFLVFKCVDDAQNVYERVGLGIIDDEPVWNKRRAFLYQFDRAAKEMSFTVI